MLYLAGLRDDYEHDGRVITQVLSHPNHALRGRFVTRLGECYKQLNSSVGKFGTDTLVASTNAMESNTAGDATYLRVDHELRALDLARDALALRIKAELEAAAFRDAKVHGAAVQLLGCLALIHAAHRVEASS
jgi:hypothetical protein